MKQLNLITIVLSVLFLVGCETKQSNKKEYITIDISKSYPKKELIMQDLFDIEYIKLETNDQFVTRGNVQGIDENFLVITDWGRTGNIYLANRQGQYVKTINRKGQGGEEYVSLSNLLYDSERQELYVGDSSSGKIVVYDLDGNFKRSFKQARGTYYEWMGNFNRDYLICNGTPQADPGDNGYEEGVLNGGFMLVSKEDGCIQKIEIPYEEYISPSMVLDTPEGKRYAGIINETQIPNLGNWILVEISSDTIYTYTQSYEKKPFIIRTPTAKVMSPEVYLYPGVITDRYYFLQTVEKEYNVKKRTGFSTRELLYDKEEKAIYEYVVYNNDFTDERPVYLVHQVPIRATILNNEDIAYVTHLNAYDLLEAYENNKLRGSLKETAANLNEEDNPVIMIAKYKKQ